MKIHATHRAWKEAVLALVDALPGLLRSCRRRASPAQLHDLRVVLRRLRLLLQLGRSLLDERALAAFRIWSRRTCDSAGPLRDADVIVEWLAESAAGLPLAEQCGRRRATAVRRWQRGLEAIPRGWRRGLGQSPTVKQKKRLARRIERVLEAGRETVRTDLRRFWRVPEEDQHEMRRQLRRWRYVLEWDRDLRKAGDPTLKQVLRLQEAMGDRGNLLLVNRWLDRTRVPADHPVRQILAAERAVLEKRLRKKLREMAQRAD